MPAFHISKKLPPLPRTYWVLDGLLLAGAYAGQPTPEAHRERLTGLFNAGMRTIINLMEEDETNGGQPFVRYQEDLQAIASASNEYVDCLRFPIVDREITTKERMMFILDAIDESIENDRPVYVHCFGGIGRTGTVICCWLLRHGHANHDNVFDILCELRKADIERSWRDAPENPMQKQFVLDWHENPVRQKARLSSNIVSRDDWFTRLTGFSERSANEVRECLSVRQNQLTSHVNGMAYQCGHLEIVSLSELRNRVAGIPVLGGKLKISEFVGDAKALHADKVNAGAVFQVASQFNLLEMVSPSVTPERGIGIYENDPTQGPACAIACGAGTIYRNYFVKLDDQIGQSATRQIDCLANIGKALGNTGNRLWKMQNGYALPSASGLMEVNEKLRSMTESEVDGLRGNLQIGVQWDTQVTLQGCKHLVTQAYCSAMPVAYSGIPSTQWEPLARLVLEAAYEATLAVGLLNAARTGNQTVYLTLLGGGAFGNNEPWILDAVKRACAIFPKSDLDVKIVSYRNSNSAVQQLIESANLTSEKTIPVPFASTRLPVHPSATAPDGTDVRLLLQLSGGSLAHFALPPGETSNAVVHRTVEELWYFLSGRGEMWRKAEDQEEIISIEAGVSVSIPVGTQFQFRSFGSEPLAFLAVTMPPWPGAQEAIVVRGKWKPTIMQ